LWQARERIAALLERAAHINAALAGLPQWSTGELTSARPVDSARAGIA
jgi:hypothetical protein